MSLPHLLKVKTKELENLQEELNTNHRLRNEVIQKLNEVTGRFKIIEKDKQKKEISFKKESQKKKIEQEIQDLFLISKGGVIS